MDKEIKVDAEPAIGVSIVTNLTDSRGITLQSFVALGDPLETQWAVLEKMFALSDRAKAKYEIAVIRDELFVHRRTLQRLEEDSKNAEHEYNRGQAVKRAEIKALERELDDATKFASRDYKKKENDLIDEIKKLQQSEEKELAEGAADWASSRREGPYEPQGAKRISLSNIKGAIEKATAALNDFRGTHDKFVAEATMVPFRLLNEAKEAHDKAIAEHGQHVQQTDITKRRYRQEIDDRVNKIKKLSAILNTELEAGDED